MKKVCPLFILVLMTACNGDFMEKDVLFAENSFEGAKSRQ